MSDKPFRPNPEQSPYTIPLIQEELEFCGLSCRSLFTEIGIGNAITYLFSILREHIPLTRIFCGFRRYKASMFTPVADTLPNAHNRLRTLPTSTFTQAQINLMMGTDDMKPYTINNAFELTAKETDLRMEDMASYLRIPMFVVGEAVFQMIFCSNIAGTFSTAISEQLLTVTRPLGEALRQRFMQTGNVQLAERVHLENSAWDRLQLCKGLEEMRRQIEQVAATDCAVLILGETGTGKEVVADSICELSSRNGRPFIKVNCGAINEQLVDSELFGHEKGAFTGAQVSRVGAFEAANGGTIFLDEVGDLPLSLQARLLRVLDRREIQKVGGTRTIPLDIRVIAATHRNLAEMVRKGEFREDLWYRLNVFVLRVPPLRSHRMDIPTLAQFFMNSKARLLNILPAPALTPEQAEELCRHNWPGNIRELEHLVERVLVRSKVGASSIEALLSQEMEQVSAMDGIYNLPLSETTWLDHQYSHAQPAPNGQQQQVPAPQRVLPPDAPPMLTSLVYKGLWPTLKELSESYIQDALWRSGGKISGPDGAAALLGVHPNTLRMRRQKSD